MNPELMTGDYSHFILLLIALGIFAVVGLIGAALHNCRQERKRLAKRNEK